MTTHDEPERALAQAEIAAEPSALPPIELDLPENPTVANPYRGAARELMADRLPPQGVDARTWLHATIISDVTMWCISHRQSNIQLACQELGWPRYLYYVARDDPFAAKLAHGLLVTIQTAAARMVEDKLLDVMDRMLHIASTGDGVSAVRAAAFVTGFLEQHKSELEQLIEAGKDLTRGEKSKAALMLDQFPPTRRVIKTRTVTDRLEVEPDDAIDVTPR